MREEQQYNKAGSRCPTTVRLKATRQRITSLGVDALRSPKVTHVVTLPHKFCSSTLSSQIAQDGRRAAEARPDSGLAIDFVVESDRAQLSEIVQRVWDGRLRTNIGNVSTLDDAVAALNPTERRRGKTVIRVRL